MKLIKVLHYGISENKGGIETYLWKIWENIDKERFQFCFIDTNLGEPSYYYEFIKEGCTFFKITPRSKSVFSNIIDLELLFRNGDFDIFHCHLNTLSYVAPIRVALKYGVKVIVHSRSSNAPRSVFTKFMHTFNQLFYFKSIEKHIEKVAVSKLSGNWLFGNRNHFTVINNGVDIEKFRFSNEKRLAMRGKLGLKNEFVIGHVGAFLSVKNHEYLVRIFKEFHDIKKDSILVLVGDGPLIDQIRFRVSQYNLSKSVLFLGSDNNVPELLSAMDAFLFPSFYEGFPNAVLEAQTSGLPILLSNTITDEILVSKNCTALNIKEEPSIWVQTLIRISDEITHINRECEYKNIESSGLSVKAEIEKLMRIYMDLMNDS